MSISENRQNELSKRFEEVFENGLELGEKYKKYEPKEYESRVKEVLEHVGFPDEANAGNVKHEYEIAHGLLDYDEWAAQFIEDKDLTEENFENINTDILIRYIFDNADQLDQYVDIQMELEEWIDENPSIEILASEIRLATENLEIAEILPVYQSEEYEEKVEMALKEKGFPPNVGVSDVNVKVYNLKLEDDEYEIAKNIIDDLREEGSLDSFVQNKLNIILVEQGAIDYKIDIISDREDF